MSGARWPRRMVRLGLLGVATMTLAVPVILLARGTTGHDWYAARKLTVAEVMIAVGFSKYTTVAYRKADGDTWNIVRAAVAVFPSAVDARRHILATIGDGVMPGAGVGGTVFCLMLLGAAGHVRRGRTATALEPVAYPYRHPSASGQAGCVAEWVRPSLRARIALLVVSPAELERLLSMIGPTRRPGFIDLPGPDAIEPAEADGELLERTEAPPLPPVKKGELGTDAKAPAKSAPSDPGSGPGKSKPDDPAGDRPVRSKRPPDPKFF